MQLSYILRGVLPKAVGGAGDALGTAAALGACVSEYASSQPNATLAAFITVYVSLQALAIPGPVVLSLLAGIIYPAWPAQLLIAACATAGSALSYLLSKAVLCAVIERAFPAKTEQFRAAVAEHRAGLLRYMVVLRLTPVLPNWFINVAAPIVGIPLATFALGTAIGLVPANFVHVTTGRTIAALLEAGQSDDVHSAAPSPMRAIAVMAGLQFLPLLPNIIAWLRRGKPKDGKEHAE